MKYQLKLYVTGRTGPSTRAIKNLERILQAQTGDDYELKVIDVLEHPQLAEDEKILATPTLVRALPEPIRKIIGDLSQLENVLLGLDIIPSPGSTKKDKS